MQITPAHGAAHRAASPAARSSCVDDLATPQVNIAYGAYYLRYLLDRYDGNEDFALAAYNAGQGNVDRWIADARAHNRALTTSAIPYAETRAYVQRVESVRRDYRRTYGSAARALAAPPREGTRRDGAAFGRGALTGPPPPGRPPGRRRAGRGSARRGPPGAG